MKRERTFTLRSLPTRVLTRLKVRGFKNLVDTDVRFGPFTCIAGANGVGKSNLFDAIALLRALADRPLLEAAMAVRDETSTIGDVRSLFTKRGNATAERMSFEAEMIVPPKTTDDLGQEAEASITYLRYRLDLGVRDDSSLRSRARIVIEREELDHVKVSRAFAHLWFPHRPSWRNSAVSGRKTSPLISTDTSGGEVRVLRHQDGGGGLPAPHAAEALPRTVLSTSNAAESRTALLARREMQSWRLLQLEPSALRQPDRFTAPTHLDLDGAHLPSTLYRLAHSLDVPASDVYMRAANRLSELIEDIHYLRVDRDDTRELLTLMAKDRFSTEHPAHALSDGTLRFLALVVLEMDPLEGGVMCLEEPENGIHPARLPAILGLLQDIAVDTSQEVGDENPLRQVIINTHSPAVVQLVPENSLLVGMPMQESASGGDVTAVRFGALPSTWRVSPTKQRGEGETTALPVPIGRILDYLDPTRQQESLDRGGDGSMPKSRRVIDRDDVRQYMIPFPEA